MSRRLTFLQRVLGVALLAAVTPYAIARTLQHDLLRFDVTVGLDESDVYDQLFDGQVASELSPEVPARPA